MGLAQMSKIVTGDAHGLEADGMLPLQCDGALQRVSASADRSALVEMVFGYWRRATGHRRARLDEKRRKTIARALAVGYSVEDLCLAVDGCMASPFHRGHNDRNTVYDSIGLIFRDADHIDKFMRLGARARAATAREEVRREETPSSDGRAMLVELKRRVPWAFRSRSDAGGVESGRTEVCE